MDLHGAVLQFHVFVHGFELERFKIGADRIGTDCSFAGCDFSKEPFVAFMSDQSQTLPQ